MKKTESLDSYKKVTESLRESNFTSHFYIDHFGFAAMCKQKRYKPEDIEIEREYEWRDGEQDTHLYAVKTEDGVRGKIVLCSTSSNFEAAEEFIQKCQSVKTNSLP